MTIRVPLALAAIGLGFASVGYAPQSAAHHSFSSEFDASRPIAVNGRVTRVRIVNPHGWVYLDVTGANGATTNWGFEFGSPAVLKAKGLSRDDIPIGSTIKIDGFRAKNTGPFGYAQSVELADGREFRIGSAPDAPSSRARR